MAFTWPTTGTGKPDNIVASGQTIPCTGSGTKLGFLATGTYGNASGDGLITYTDGTTQPYTLAVAVPLQAGKTVAYLTLPNVGPNAAKSQVALHIFATGIG
ncbi:hypothetical protein OG495_32410 [Streptomyces longwoodensis]|uniref:hypothetical protein n=1 Tax=Streptomyces longwoodensis TaxID=68231 RepID=UPI00386718D0